MKILDLQEFLKIDKRYEIDKNTEKSVKEIIELVKNKKDSGVMELTEKFDKVKLSSFKVTKEEIEEAFSSIEKEVLDSIKYAIKNIEKFANRQILQLKDFKMEIANGVYAGQKVLPLDKVCIYVPGGNFPLFSSAIMGIVPAKVALVNEIYLTTPPDKFGKIKPEIIVAGILSGVKDIYKIGGAQAIAAFTFGTDYIPKVDKIAGPGNKYVAEAKKQLFGEVGIDMIAGPTELLVIADEFASSDYVKYDLMAQAEHDKDAKVYLISDNSKFIKEVKKKLENEILNRSISNTCKAALNNNCFLIYENSKSKIVQLANNIAPEHLSLQVKDIKYFENKLKNYGSLFIGENSCEAVADYCAGINHTLPTNKNAKFKGGLSVFDFVKCLTTLKVNCNFDKNLFKNAKKMANAEGLIQHANSISKRI